MEEIQLISRASSILILIGGLWLQDYKDQRPRELVVGGEVSGRIKALRPKCWKLLPCLASLITSQMRIIGAVEGGDKKRVRVALVVRHGT